jgi:hypothetical protein
MSFSCFGHRYPLSKQKIDTGVLRVEVCRFIQWLASFFETVGGIFTLIARGSLAIVLFQYVSVAGLARVFLQ